MFIPDGKVEVAIAIHVPPRYARRVILLSRGPDRAGGQHPSIIAVDPVRLSTIADGEVKVAVAVHIAPGHTGGDITLGG